VTDTNQPAGGAAADNGAAAGAAASSGTGCTPEALAAAQAKAQENWNSYLRAVAEFDNYRKRMDREIDNSRKYAIERFAQELLIVKDALEQTVATPSATIQTLKDGVELTLKNLQAAFDKAQVVEINPQGEKYDPHRHQAMTMLESDQPPGTVVQVFQKGYLLNDRVLRPALVAVAKARDAAAPGPAAA
jgi:molecular chaperone GrpE